MAEKICFLGRSGVGKSVIVSNISAALCRMGYNVLQIGNDMSLTSTLLLRENEPVPVLEEFRRCFDICIEKYMIKTSAGVYCIELGNIDPGAGCMARGLSIVDELMEQQKLLEKYQIHYVLYDVAGDIPCTGYILPVREHLIDQCILISNAGFASVCTVNSLAVACIRSGTGHPPVRLLANQTDRYDLKNLVEAYAKETNLTLIDYFDYYEQVALSVLEETCVVHKDPESTAAQAFEQLAKKVITCESVTEPEPFCREQLMQWQKQFKLMKLYAQSGIIDADYSMNI